MSEKPGLSYYPPKPVKPHTTLHIPGSHTLYVGPPSCTRRHAIQAAEYGDKRNASFLLLSESDIALGHYGDIIGDAVRELIEILPTAPYIFFIAVFCVDDFLGRDEEALLEQLHTRFVGRKFAVNHIDPVNLGKESSMGREKHINMYSFLEPAAKRDKGINFLGSFVPLEPECELLDFLENWGFGPIREIFQCADYQQYQEMAKSRLTVVLRFIADGSAEYMRDKLGIPYYCFPASYNAKLISARYGELAELLGIDRQDFSHDEEETSQEARETARVLAGLPVALDAGAFLTPFAAARALLSYGFNVRYIVRSRHLFDADAGDRDYISTNCGWLKVMREDSRTEPDQSSEPLECLAIGASCARRLNAKFFADVWHDEGYFGFHGIRRLMKLLRSSVK